MIRKIIFTGLLIRLFMFDITAQEVILPLEINPAKSGQNKIRTKNAKSDVTPLLLPFKEDFSYPGPYPDAKLWSDSYVFVNGTFALHPKTIGTATFDALNQFGEIYDDAEDNPFQFEADFLTTHPIRLDSVFSPVALGLSPQDSVLLTFYFQPQGKGSAPRIRDSLALEFLLTPGHYMEDDENPENPIWIEDEWINVWSTAGGSLNEFVEANNGNYFKRVAVKIEDPGYFRQDFRFRFRNYGSFPFSKTPSNFAGNTSIWNIDYITLDYGRTIADSFYYDIAFVQPAKSILRQYHSMPWSHYIVNPQNHLKPRFDLAISNLDNETYNYSYRYFIQDEQGTTIRNYSGGTWNIAPFHVSGYQSYDPHTSPIVIPNPLPTGPAAARQFKIFHVIREGAQGDDLQRNDTIVFNQVFDNYFAYDDGIPETGYGLVGFSPQGATRFVLSRGDTLTAVKFYFNPTLYNQNRKSFYLKVWKNLEPEEVIYQSEILTTQFQPGSNEFITYDLDEPLIVSDTIYVGWQQVTNDFLNIGFDLDNNSRDNLFYNTHGQWLTSVIDGALMIRPVFGDAVFTQIPVISNTNEIEIFPNPSRGDFLNIGLPEHFGNNFMVRIFDAGGKLIYTNSDITEPDIRSFNNGLYFLVITSEINGESLSGKFLIAR
jgi:hypothetical protein